MHHTTKQRFDWVGMSRKLWDLTWHALQVVGQRPPGKWHNSHNMYYWHMVLTNYCTYEYDDIDIKNIYIYHIIHNIASRIGPWAKNCLAFQSWTNLQKLLGSVFLAEKVCVLPGKKAGVNVAKCPKKMAGSVFNRVFPSSSSGRYPTSRSFIDTVDCFENPRSWSGWSRLPKLLGWIEDFWIGSFF